MPRKKQRRAWGSVTEIKRGKKYVLRWADHSKRCGRATETFYGTYREACERLDVIHADIATGKTSQGNRATVADVYERWVFPDYQKRLGDGTLKENTYNNYVQHWRVHIEPRWGNVVLSDIAAVDVQEWLNGLTKSVARISLTVLKRIGDVAVNLDIIETNKFRRDYSVPTDGAKQSSRVYDLAAANVVYNEMRGKSCEAPFIIACFGGARTGESLGVKTSDVEFREMPSGLYAYVPVLRTVNLKPAASNDGALKNASSVRPTVVPPPYSRRLLEIVSDRKASGIEWLADRGDGMPIDRRMLSYRWHRECSTAIPFKNLRASWRTFAELEWGISDRTLELMMGHKLPGVSGSHYIRADAQQIISRFEREFAKNVTT